MLLVGLVVNLCDCATKSVITGPCPQSAGHPRGMGRAEFLNLTRLRWCRSHQTRRYLRWAFPIGDFEQCVRESRPGGEREDLRTNLYEIGDEVCGLARAIAPEDEGDFRASIEMRPGKYKKLGKTTRVARVVSTDDPKKVATIIHGRGEDEEGGATPAFDVWNRTAAVFNSPPDDD